MAVPGYVLKNKRTTLERAQKFISRDEWTDCNLVSRLYKKKSDVKNIIHFAARDRITYDDAIIGLKNEGKPASVGQSFGPTWSTHWFQIDLEIPNDWMDDEVCFYWDSGSEAMIWIDGRPMQGLTNQNRRTEYVLPKKLLNGNRLILYIEMACNGVLGAGNGMIAPPQSNKTFTLSVVQIVVVDQDVYSLIRDFEVLVGLSEMACNRVEGCGALGQEIAPPDPDLKFTLNSARLVVLDKDVFKLYFDLEVLIGLAQHLPEDSHRVYNALFAANDMVNTIVLDDRRSYEKASEIASKLFSEKNGQAQQTVAAIGNCHIDTAWLWPYAETIRKCARSFSSSIRILEKYPKFTFACSQAQQFEWMKMYYPTLYEEMKLVIKDGRFIPVGGAWVEMDGLMPSGEAMIRQFLYGQRFYKKEFNITCKEFWLPDTFGYSGQLPQIMKHVGIERFVTQKLSWSLINKFPHHTFWWNGIDGSSVLTHFPPADSYTNMATVKEVLHSASNFRDKGRSNSTMFLYGYGDGGQGPTNEMIERLQRLENVDGCPKVKMTTPDAFFTDIEEHEGENLCKWSGELYLELHNGTYTSQAKTKQGNRSCEILLHNVEAMSSIAHILDSDNSYKYPANELLRVWKLLMINQFHDVLPGSSINIVYKDALAYYKDVTKSSGQMFDSACKALLEKNGGEEKCVLFNTHSWDRTEVVSLPSSGSAGSPAKKKHKNDEDPLVQTDHMGNSLILTFVPSYGYSVLFSINDITPVTVEKGRDGHIYMKNSQLEVVLDNCGRIVGLSQAGSSKNAIACGELGNQLVIFDDIPLYWDAWDVMDYHLETRKPLETVIQQATIVDHGPLRATVEVSLKISDQSYLKQFIILDAGCPFLKFETEVNWHESHKFLKVEFPVNVLAQQATYEIQFGHLQRPTHFNTSWDWAKYEVCGHKWADVSEYDFGVAVLNDSKYGWSCINNVLRLSLLRSPKSPDEKADMGVQTFKYAVMPHSGTFQDAGVVQSAYALNNPLQIRKVRIPDNLPDDNSYFSVDKPSIILETVKKSEDDAKCLVLRLYEAYGGRTTAEIQVSLPLKTVVMCNGLEDIEIDDDAKEIKPENGAFKLDFQPFQIKTVMLKF